MATIKIKKLLKKPQKTGQYGPYTPISILTVGNQGQDIWVTGTEKNWNRHWKDGDSVDVLIEKKVGQDGNPYYVFKSPVQRYGQTNSYNSDNGNEMLTGIKQVLARLDSIEAKLSPKRTPVAPANDDFDPPPPSDDDMPFGDDASFDEGMPF